MKESFIDMFIQPDINYIRNHTNFTALYNFLIFKGIIDDKEFEQFLEENKDEIAKMLIEQEKQNIRNDYNKYKEENK